MPTGDPGVAALDPVAIRACTFEALQRLLVAEAGHRPLVLLIEDLHWIDQTSEEFLRRRALHGRAGACLEDSQASQRFEHGELLAYHYARSAVPARAIPYLAAAGARAKDRYANEEAIRLYRKALSIVGDLPAGSDRDRQELEILEAIAAPLAARYGYPSPEGQRTFERTVALAESLGRNDSTVADLVALWQSRFVQGRTADTYQIANRALSIVDPSSQLTSQVHLIMGGSAVSLGRPTEGLRHLELAADLAVGPAWLITGARADIFRTPARPSATTMPAW